MEGQRALASGPSQFQLTRWSSVARALDLGEDGLGGGGPHVGLRVVVVGGEVALDAGDQVRDAAPVRPVAQVELSHPAGAWPVPSLSRNGWAWECRQVCEVNYQQLSTPNAE